MTPETLRAVVSNYFASIGRMDPEAYVSCFAGMATVYEPAAPAPLTGHVALRQFFIGLGGAFQQISMAEDHVFVTGNRVAVKFTGHAVGKNGKAVEFQGIDVFEINDSGKISTLWGYWDPAGMMAKLQG